MRLKVHIVFLFIAFCSCGQFPASENNEKKDTLIQTDEVQKDHTLAGCYVMRFDKDSGFLRLEKDDTGVKGVLNYYRYQKDRNEGTITGNETDSLISGWYTFQSEGKTSVRELVFKISQEGLIEGTGVMEFKKDTLFFTNKSELLFDKQHPFVKQPCK